MLKLMQGSIYVGAHANWKYDANRAQVIARRLSSDWENVRAATGATCVAVTGTSGLCVAMLMNTFCEVPFVFVRKPGDTKNSGSVEGRLDTDVSRYLFLDDLVASGASRERTIVALQFAFDRFGDYQKPQWIGEWLYEGLFHRPTSSEIEIRPVCAEHWLIRYQAFSF